MTRLFNLDFQLLHDSALLAISVFFLCMLLSYLLFNPARKLLADRAERIAGELASAASDQKAAAAMKAEYEQKLASADKEIDALMADARKRALASEADIIDEAKKEASRIIAHAKEEARLEQVRAADEVKQQMIAVAALMAQRVVSEQIDTSIQEKLVDDTIKELGAVTWQS